jgi:hypothetical protein
MPPRKRAAAPSTAPAAGLVLLAQAMATAPTAGDPRATDTVTQQLTAAADVASVTPPGPSDLGVDDQPLETLPDGKAYDSCDEDDAPARVLEDEALVALANDKEPTAEKSTADGGSPAKQPATAGAQDKASPTRAKSVLTGVVNVVKKLTAAAQRKQDVRARIECRPLLHL